MQNSLKAHRPWTLGAVNKAEEFVFVEAGQRTFLPEKESSHLFQKRIKAKLALLLRGTIDDFDESNIHDPADDGPEISLIRFFQKWPDGAFILRTGV